MSELIENTEIKDNALSNNGLYKKIEKNNFFFRMLCLALGILCIVLALLLLLNPAVTHFGGRDYTVESTFDVNDPQWRENSIIASSDNEYARERSILDKNLGEGVELILLDNPCGVQYKYLINACVLSTDVEEVIYISKEIKDTPRLEASALIIHELGHIYQQRLSDDFLASNPVVKKTFSGEEPVEEVLADCMAEVVTSITTGAYTNECSPEQLVVAQQVWDGIIPVE
jgi:hypothetical protein